MEVNTITKMNNDSKFSTGLVLGLIIGGGAVFLLGTRTGKNLLKILSEQGLDGFLSLLEEYDLDNLEEYEENSESEEYKSNGVVKEKKTEKVSEEEKVPKKRFFRRVKR